MNLYLLRHGLAVEPGTGGYARDADRPLTEEGESKMRKIAKAMRALELSFDVILSSPYLRARQTAEIVAEALDARKKLQLTDALTPSAHPRDLMEALRSLKSAPEEVLLTGHEPYLSRLIALLISGDASLAVEMKKGGLCKLSVESLEIGRCATLAWLLTPKQMLLMSKA